MEQRQLGSTGLTVSVIGYGSMGTAVGYGPTDDTSSIAAIRTAHEVGITHFDTAEMYGWGAGEELLGRALAPIRDEVTIATKFGFTRAFAPDSRPDHLRDVVEASLRRLGTDHIDLLYQHVHDPAVPIEEVVGTMQEFVTAGTVRHLGLSNTDDENLRRAHATHPIAAVQMEYSLFTREAEPILATARELGIGFVAYSPLARGFLSGAVRPRSEYGPDDFRQHIGWWSADHYDHNTQLVAALTELATARDLTLAQLSLAWLVTRGVVPIPGSRNPDRVRENAAAADLTLTAADLAAIDRIIPDGGSGSRAW